MAKSRFVGPEERQKIIDLLHEHGGNRHKVAGMVKRSKRTVQKIADAEGIAGSRLHPKEATEAHQRFSEEKQLQTLGLAMEVVEKYLEGLQGYGPTKENSEALQKVLVAMGIAIDKRLLLTGKPTNINESRKGNDVGSLFSELKGEVEERWKG